MEDATPKKIATLDWDTIYSGSIKYQEIIIPDFSHGGQDLHINLLDKLGGGANGVTYETINTLDSSGGTNNHALKIVKLSDQSEVDAFKMESKVQENIAKQIGIAPNVHGYSDLGVGSYGFLLMDKIRPVTKKDLIKTVYNSNIEQVKNLIETISLSVYNGFIHNDLHTGNIAKKYSSNDFILIDFGFTQEISRLTPPSAPVLDASGKPITSNQEIIFNQILIAQLYALVEHCNSNNFNIKCPDAPVCREKIQVCPKSTQFSKKNRKKVCNVSRYVTLDSQIIKNISSQCSSAIMDVIYNLRTNSPTIIGELHYNWYKYAHAIMTSQEYNGELIVEDDVMAAPPLPPSPNSPKPRKSRRLANLRDGGGKTRNITTLSIQNIKPRRSRNKRSQKSSKKRSQKAGGRRRSFKSQRRASLKFNKKK